MKHGEHRGAVRWGRISQALAPRDRLRAAWRAVGRGAGRQGTEQRTAPPCPSCGSAKVVPVLIGYPTRDAMKAARRGEIVLHGCIVSARSPDFVCRACGHEWQLPTHEGIELDPIP